MKTMTRAEMHDVNPVDFMVYIAGQRTIRVEVSIIVACGFLLCGCILYFKPWTKSAIGVWSTSSSDLSRGSLGGDLLLLLYRLSIFAHLLSIALQMYSYRGAVMLLFYTNWTFLLEVLYFFFATLSSLKAKWQKPVGPVGWFGAALIAHLHVTLGACMVVDVLHWGLLWPLLKKTKDPVALAYHTSTTFSWISYNTHALNLVFIIGDLMLNCIPYCAYLMGFMGLYTAVFGIFAFGFYSQTGRWIYPFLNANKTWAPYMYIGIFAGHLLFFGIVYLLFKMRDWIRGTTLAATGPFLGRRKADKQH